MWLLHAKPCRMKMLGEGISNVITIQAMLVTREYVSNLLLSAISMT